MRTLGSSEPVRLYHLDPASGAIATLCYAPLAEVLRVGAGLPAETRADLFVQTRDDVIAFVDLADG